MSEKQKRRRSIVNQRRTLFTYRIFTRLAKTLGPFTPREVIRLSPNKTIESLDPDTLHPTKKRGFIAKIYASIPKHTLRRFLFITSAKQEPSQKEYRTLEREILGAARQILTGKLKTAIKKLPHKTGKRKGFTKQEKLQLLERVNNKAEEEKQKAIGRGETPKRGYKDDAVRAIAKEIGFKNPRQVWRLIRDV